MCLPASLGLGYHPHWPHKNAGLGGDVEGEFVKREEVRFSEDGGKTPDRQSKRCSLCECSLNCTFNITIILQNDLQFRFHKRGTLQK